VVEKIQTRQKRENKQEEDEEEDVDCTCYEAAFGWCKVCKPKEEEEEQEEEEESADIERVKKRHVKFDEEFDEEYEKFDKKWQEEHWTEIERMQPKAKRQRTFEPGEPVKCEYCGHVVRRDGLHRHQKGTNVGRRR